MTEKTKSSKVDKKQEQGEVEDGNAYEQMTKEPDFDPANYDVKEYVEKNAKK